MATLILTGDVNLMNVDDPAVPFARVRDAFRAADMVFANLECCLYHRRAATRFTTKDFSPTRRSAAKRCGMPGSAPSASPTTSITATPRSWRRSRGSTRSACRIPAPERISRRRALPAIVERGGLRFGFLQRSSVYWPTNHEAGPHDPGIAVIRGHTAYQVPMHKTRPEIPPMNRPGIPPIVVTWADPDYLRAFADDIAALRAQADIVVASCHWGLGKEVLAYMREIAHAAIDAGADIVIGHGPHYSLPVEVYRGKPIFYGLGSFSFHTGHGGRAHGDWVGMMARAQIEGARLVGGRFPLRAPQRAQRDGALRARGRASGIRRYRQTQRRVRHPAECRATKCGSSLGRARRGITTSSSARAVPYVSWSAKADHPRLCARHGTDLGGASPLRAEGRNR